MHILMKFSWFCLVLGKASPFNGVSRRLASCKYKLGYIDLSKVVQRHLLSVQRTISTSDMKNVSKWFEKNTTDERKGTSFQIWL